MNTRRELACGVAHLFSGVQPPTTQLVLSMIDGFLLKLLDYAEELCPVQVVLGDQRGIRRVCGRPWKVLQPGAHLHLFKLYDIDIIDVTEETVMCVMQSVTTSDGKTLTAEITMLREVSDPIAFRYNATDADECIRSRACDAVTAWANEHTLEECLKVSTLQGQMFTNFKATCTRKYGARITEICIEQLTPAPVHRIMGWGE